jgi:hypothetical protein
MATSYEDTNAEVKKRRKRKIKSDEDDNDEGPPDKFNTLLTSEIFTSLSS